VLVAGVEEVEGEGEGGREGEQAEKEGEELVTVDEAGGEGVEEVCDRTVTA